MPFRTTDDRDGNQPKTTQRDIELHAVQTKQSEERCARALRSKRLKCSHKVKTSLSITHCTPTSKYNSIFLARPDPINALHQEEHQQTQTETANDTYEAEHITQQRIRSKRTKHAFIETMSNLHVYETFPKQCDLAGTLSTTRTHVMTMTANQYEVHFFQTTEMAEEILLQVKSRDFKHCSAKRKEETSRSFHEQALSLHPQVSRPRCPANPTWSLDSFWHIVRRSNRDPCPHCPILDLRRMEASTVPGQSLHAPHGKWWVKHACIPRTA